MLSDQDFPLGQLEHRIPPIRILPQALEAVVRLIQTKVAQEGNQFGQDEAQIGETGLFGRQLVCAGEEAEAEVVPVVVLGVLVLAEGAGAHDRDTVEAHDGVDERGYIGGGQADQLASVLPVLEPV